MMAVGMPIRLFHVMKEAGVDQDIEALRLKRGQQGISNNKAIRCFQLLSLRLLPSLLNGKRQIVETYGLEASPGKEEGVPPCTAAQVQNTAFSTCILQASGQ